MAGSSESKLTVSVTKEGSIFPIVSCFGAEQEKKLAASKKLNDRRSILKIKIKFVNLESRKRKPRITKSLRLVELLCNSLNLR